MRSDPGDLSLLTRSPQNRSTPPGRADSLSISDAGAGLRSDGAAPVDASSRVPLPKRNWRTRVLLPGLILFSVAAILAYSLRDVMRSAKPVRVAAAVLKSDVSHQAKGSVVVQAPGWVEADPFAIAVSALADGIVSEMLVLEGQPVETGQVVARLVDEDARIALSLVEARLAESKAALAVAQSVLKEAQQNWEHPIELVRRLETAKANLAEKEAELARWPSELAREQAQAVYLAAEAERIATLRGSGDSAQIENIRAAQEYEAQKAQVEVTRKREPILKAQIESLRAEVVAADEDLRLRIADTRSLAEAKAAVRRAEATVASMRAARDEAALRLERMEVRSPATGVVLSRLIEPGSKLMLNMDNPRSAQVVRLYDPEKLQVRVDIPLVDAAKVGVGQPAEVIVDVLPDRVYEGHVSRIVHEADVQKNTLQVKVAIHDPSAELKPEMLARARFLAMGDDVSQASGSSSGMLFIPQSAVMDRDGGKQVWLADQAEHVAVLREVTLSQTVQDDWVAVAAGIQSGDRVIVNAPDDLKSGDRIRLIED